jgi:16S rRNA G527 N7-methylase RsmG
LGTDTSSTTDEQLEQFLAVVDGVNRVFDTVNTEDHEEINEEQLDEIARLVFQTQELRTALASTVSGLIQQAGSGIETPK